MDQRKIEINLTGEGIRPGSIRSKDIAQVITSVEDMIAAMLAHDNPNINKDDVIIGLSSISRGSLALGFDTPLSGLATVAYERIIDAINREIFDRLPSAAISAIEELAKVSRRCNTEIELQSKDETTHLIAIITPETRVTPATYITEKTVLYGEVSRVGGDEPKVRIKFIDGTALSCPISKQLALQLASRLYDIVAMRGVAKWRVSDLILEEFTIEQILPYCHQSARKSFTALRELGIGKYFNDITDVPDYIRKLRSDEGNTA